MRAYYDALSRHSFSAAGTYLAPATRSFIDSTIDSPANNLLSLSGVKIDDSSVVSTASLPGLPTGISTADYDSFAQVVVEYEETFRRVITDHDGQLTRFLYLGKSRSSDQWQILSIGSGP